jgi:PhzF family phenazine biosynthesis protein
MSAEIHLIDAFTDTPFRGNPAGVCILEQEADPPWMQSVAAEIGASETAFLLPRTDGWGLRWFTPLTEVDLCGHGTLAAAFVLWMTGRENPGDTIAFATRSGRLPARKRGGWIRLDFPADPESPSACPEDLRTALGAEPVYTGKGRFDYLVELSSAEQVRALRPDRAEFGHVPARGIIATAISDMGGADFVSRFFAPSIGIPEDPVTGSAHCCLGPYWGKKLGKDSLTGFQLSARGGTVRLTLQGDRVVLAGKAVPVLSGKLHV